MSQLDQEHDVVALAKELGLPGNPAEAIVQFCEAKIDRWANDIGGVENVASLEQLVADRLRVVFEEVYSDEDLERIIAKYKAQREGIFATLREELNPATFGLTIKRKYHRPDSRDKYVSAIDCRGEKAARRFFTRWHEIAHLLVLEKELESPVRRSSHDPLERLMDEIAGRIGFYEPIFGPIFASRQTAPPLEFKTVEAVRATYCDTASFQATLFACHRRMTTPVVYVEAMMKYKAEEEQRVRSNQKNFLQDDPPVAKLRIGLSIANQTAIDRDFRVVPKMRVPECSVIHRLYFDPTNEQASGQENLSDWEFSNGGSLPACKVWIDARKAGERIIAIVQPVN